MADILWHIYIYTHIWADILQHVYIYVTADISRQVYYGRYMTADMLQHIYIYINYASLSKYICSKVWAVPEAAVRLSALRETDPYDPLTGLASYITTNVLRHIYYSRYITADMVR